jgi:hypothetical protein
LNLEPVAGNAGRAYAIVSDEFQSTWILLLYILGVIATAWHLAYGFWLFAVDWGVVIGEKAQKMTLYASLALRYFWARWELTPPLHSLNSVDCCRQRFVSRLRRARSSNLSDFDPRAQLKYLCHRTEQR